MRLLQMFKTIRLYFMALIVQRVVRWISFIRPLQENKFFCMSMNGNNYGDNIKCISDYINKRHSNPIIIWAFGANMKEKPSEIKYVDLFSLDYYYHIYSSKYVITNFAFDFRYVIKKKEQLFLQTWHGTALKQIGYDMYKNEKQGVLYRWFGVDRIKYTVDNTDLWISGSSFMSKIFKERFDNKKQIYETGTPRNDVFFRDNAGIVDNFKLSYGIDKSKKILLYAPTFRVANSFSHYNVDLKKIKVYWESKFGGEYVILIRLHPSMLKNEEEFSKLFPYDTINVSSYPDMQEVLAATDLLVTDYSSSMFDFMYKKKPVILYVPDRKTYSRGFYFDIDELPFIVVNDNSELLSKLSQFDEKGYISKLDSFLNQIGSAEYGDATEKVYNLLVDTKR